MSIVGRTGPVHWAAIIVFAGIHAALLGLCGLIAVIGNAYCAPAAPTTTAEKLWEYLIPLLLFALFWSLIAPVRRKRLDAISLIGSAVTATIFVVYPILIPQEKPAIPLWPWYLCFVLLPACTVAVLVHNQTRSRISTA